MESEMQDKPLPSLEKMKEYEIKYLKLNLEDIFIKCKNEYINEKTKHQERQLTATRYYGQFDKNGVLKKSFSYDMSLIELNKMEKRFESLMYLKWNWDEYFSNIEIDDYYVRWYFKD